MPGRDQSGPEGKGPATGGGAGGCVSSAQPGNWWGRGLGWTRPGGRGHRYWFYATGKTRWQRAAEAAAGAATTTQEKS